ncbi:hypothetical protein DFH06DRAFT_1434329 [Mycena polygramma]|nr:hypothetical protein DFH06DRAFT_1434329 [Mycena polygramma]
MNNTNTTHNATADSVGGHGGIGTKIKGAAQTVNGTPPSPPQEISANINFLMNAVIGLGENVRGTILGGVETVLHKDSTANDAIAAKGRAQQADGLRNLRGPAAGGSAPAGGAYPVQPPTNEGYSAGSAMGQDAPQQTGAADPYTNTVTQQASQAPHTGGFNPQAQHDTHHDPYTNTVSQQASQAPHTGGAGLNSHDPHHDPALAQQIPAYDGPGNAQTHLARGDRPVEEPRHHRDDAISGAGAGTGGVGQQGQGMGQAPPAYSSID